MAKIIKVGPKNITPIKTDSQSKTSRNSTTNPFKYSNFEGNTLQFADVFEGFHDTKKDVKSIKALSFKAVASAVVGSMSKMHTSIIEPIAAFANRIKSGIVSAWHYANNTSISDLPVIRDINVNINAFNETMTDKLASMDKSIKDYGKNITSKMGFLNADIIDVGHILSEKWNSLIAKHSANKYMGQPVEDLREALISALG